MFRRMTRSFAVPLPLVLVLGGFCLVSCSRSPSPSRAPSLVPGSPARLKWNLDTLVGDYDRAGKKNPQWDEAARRALTLFAEVRNTSSQVSPTKITELGAAVQSAVNAGCDDPLIRYLQLRFNPATFEATPAGMAAQYAAVAQELRARQYSAIRCLYGALRAAQALDDSHRSGEDTNAWFQANKLLADAANDMQALLGDPTTPAEEIIEAMGELMPPAMRRKNFNEQCLATIYSPVFARWPDDPLVCRQEGWFYLEYAWRARGGGFANTVAPEAWKLFNERLRTADKALRRAWRLNPKDAQTPVLMIRVALGLQEARPEMEKWFERAMAVNTNNYDACFQKLWYLDPRWYGSAEDLVAFGKECVASRQWGGRVPLILADAHAAVVNYECQTDAERKAYWTRPEVWADIQASFARFFALNPNAEGYHQNYALFAYWCQQWDELNRQLDLLGTVNYDYFGGREAYDKMVEEAKAHATK